MSIRWPASGNYVEASEWNALIAAPDVAVIDTRNDYEVAIGTFDGAVDPATRSFGEFPAWWEANKARFHNKRIAMFCTGGIRCEKSTNYLLGQGVRRCLSPEGWDPEVSGGRAGRARAAGRVSASSSTAGYPSGHGLREGPHELCFACRRPILPEDRARPEYEAGVSCHHCADETSSEDKARFRERQKQVALAAARGERHIGS